MCRIKKHTVLRIYLQNNEKCSDESTPKKRKLESDEPVFAELTPVSLASQEAETENTTENTTENPIQIPEVEILSTQEILDRIFG